MICDAATVREGTLQILGGGVTRISLTELPAPLPVTFAFRAVLETRELRPRYQLLLSLLNYNGETQGVIEANFEVTGEPPSAEEAGLATPISLRPFVVSQTGKYLIEASLDNHAIGNFPLRVELLDSDLGQN
jgi:hypothetical protein